MSQITTEPKIKKASHMGAIFFESLSANRVYLLSPLGFDPAYYAEARTLNLVLEKRRG